MRTPQSSSSANSSRSRKCPQASRIACAWRAVRTCGARAGAASLTVRRRCGLPLATCCKNGLQDVAAGLPRPAGCMTASRPASGTPRRAWNSQKEASAASLRFTLEAAQWCATVGSTATVPQRAAGGSRSHATKPATSSAVTARQSTPCPAR